MGLRIAGATKDKFDILQRRAEQQASTQTQEQKDALKRRFAALGATGSGEAIKLEQQAGEAGARRLATAREGIEFAKLGEQERLDAEQRAREFQTSERLGSQEFGAGETALGRKFAASQADLQRGFLTGERLGSQEFGASQADLQRNFLTGEREAGQEFATGEREAGQEFATGERLGAQDFATSERIGAQDFSNDQLAQTLTNTLEVLGVQQSFERELFDIEFAEQVRVTNENLKMAQAEANKKDPNFLQQLGINPNFSFGNSGSLGSPSSPISFNTLKQGSVSTPSFSI